MSCCLRARAGSGGESINVLSGSFMVSISGPGRCMRTFLRGADSDVMPQSFQMLPISSCKDSVLGDQPGPPWAASSSFWGMVRSQLEYLRFVEIMFSTSIFFWLPVWKVEGAFRFELDKRIVG